MPTFAQDPVSIGQDGFTTSVTPTQSLGAVGRTKDGRVFRYCRAGVADLVAGNLVQGPAVVPAHLAITPLTAVIGATQVSATLGATAATAGQYAEGILGIDGGYAHCISGHGAVLSGGVITLNLRADDPLQVALPGTFKVNLVANPYSGVIQMPTAAGGLAVGVAGYIIPAGQYGWVQVMGLASVLVNGTPGLNVAVTNGATAAGSIDVITTTNLVTSRVIGYMAQAGVTGKACLVNLCIN
jgi:hypothetical protein